MPTTSVENCLNFCILLFYSEIWQSAADSSETLVPCNYFVKKLQVVIQAEISIICPLQSCNTTIYESHSQILRHCYCWLNLPTHKLVSIFHITTFGDSSYSIKFKNYAFFSCPFVESTTTYKDLHLTGTHGCWSCSCSLLWWVAVIRSPWRLYRRPGSSLPGWPAGSCGCVTGST